MLGRRISKCQAISAVVLFLLLFAFAVKKYRVYEDEQEGNFYRRLKASYNYDGKTVEHVTYNKQLPLIWIGGVPRSGTTLARAILDAHPDVRCGEETRVIPRILGNHVHILKNVKEMRRLNEARITEDVLDDAIGAYILSIITKHGEPAPRLCNKDPFALRFMHKLLHIFPNSKFILMLRDGRATVHSIISRKVTIKGFDTKSWRGAMQNWNKAIRSMYETCLSVGQRRCMTVHYEKLVLHPKAELERLLKFLHVPWNDIVLHHERTVGQEGGIHLSKTELSTDQVDKPVNTRALTRWADFVPDDVKQEMAQLAPMLERLGYDPHANPPNYGRPDAAVQRQDAMLLAQQALQRSERRPDEPQLQRQLQQDDTSRSETQENLLPQQQYQKGEY